MSDTTAPAAAAAATSPVANESPAVSPAAAVPAEAGAAVPTETGAPVYAAEAGAGAAVPLSNASLYVGELDPSVTEAMLYELFNICGPVASIRVCRDAITRRSLGYAYVNFHNHSDGERALEALNYTEIKDRPCRIMWSQRDPSLRKTGSGNIFIKNLDPSIDNKALHDTFAAFGEILSCKVSTNDAGESRGFGFVHYESSKSADLAIEKVNGMLLNDTKVYVAHHIPNHERQAKINEKRSQFTNLYIKSLPTEVDDAELSEMFSKFGEITSAIVQKDEEGNSRGFGFVNFADHEAANKALDELHDSEYKGQTLFVSRAQKKAEREEELRSQYEQSRNEKLSRYQGVNLYIKNFEDDVDDDKLRQEFAPYGAITSAKVMRDERGVSRGFGFVCFTSPEEANKATAEMNGRMWGNKPLYVALAQRRDQRRQQIEATKRQRQGAMPMGAPFYGAPMYYPPGYAPPRPVYPAPRPGGRWQGAQPPVPGQYPMPGQFPVPGQYPMPGQRPARPRNPRQTGGRGGYAARGGRGGYRNNPRAAQQTPTQAQESSPADAPAADEQAAAPVLTAAALASAPEEEQKQMLGESLYPMIAVHDEERAPKITGMLLEMDNSELLHLLENSDALKAKVDEAIQVLKEDENAEAAE